MTVVITEQTRNIVTIINESPQRIVVRQEGVRGTDGVGVPAGGTAGQVLSKIDSTNYNTQWVTGGGGGGVTDHTQLTNIGTNTHAQIDSHISNKSTDGTFAGNSDTLYPSQKAAKTYVDAAVATKQDTGNYITALTGDITASGPGSAVATIANLAVKSGKIAASAVTNAKIADGTIDLTAKVTGALPVANGGTAGTTAATARVNLGIDKRTTFSNANVTITSSDSYVAQVGTMSASRTATLPAANALNAGQSILVADESGTVTTTNTIVVSRAGSDTIEGLTSVTIANPNGAIEFITDGTSKWTITSKPNLDIQVFTGSGTWTKRAGVTLVRRVLIGGGGGGGSGRRDAAGTVRNGGGGGGGGGYTDSTISAALCAATETVTIGAGGSGGAAVTADTTAGNIGTSGGNTSFGTAATASYVGASGGLPGEGGGAVGSSSTGGAGGAGTSSGGPGATVPASGAVGVAAVPGPTGGGGAGGSLNASNTVRAGSAGGLAGSYLIAGGAGGAATGASGSSGTGSGFTNPPSGGSGGGAGGSGTGVGGSGGAGGSYGGGGGGGASSVNGNNSGAGGAGAAGIAVIFSW